MRVRKSIVHFVIFLSLLFVVYATTTAVFDTSKFVNISNNSIISENFTVYFALNDSIHGNMSVNISDGTGGNYTILFHNASATEPNSSYFGFDTENYTDGNYTIEFISYNSTDDTYYNISYDIRIDNTAPAISLPNGSTINTTNNFTKITFNYTDSTAATAKCRLYINTTNYNISNTANGSSVTATNNSNTVISVNNTGLADGFYAFIIGCQDTASPWNEGNSSQTTVHVDSTAPTASDIESGSITTSTATITSSTNENADRTIAYSTNTNNLNQYGSNAEFGTSLSVDLTALSAGTKYYYEVQACDEHGNCVTDGQYDFTTNANSGSGGSSGGVSSGSGGATTTEDTEEVVVEDTTEETPTLPATEEDTAAPTSPAAPPAPAGGAGTTTMIIIGLAALLGVGYVLFRKKK
tara:strand:+ start:162 stop:1394 length:1233 start_codon:yes stop_codon:yes gene_type:complete